MTAGDRQLVRDAIAAYFGGNLQTEDAGIYFQGGPLSAYGLGTAYPYKIKGGAPDPYYTAGQPEGNNWGAVLTVALGRQNIVREAMGGKTSGWRQRHYEARLSLDVLSYEPHLETAEAGTDDLIDALLGLIYADRTLGTTGGIYNTLANGRLIQQAGEDGPNGTLRGIEIGEADWETVDAERGKGRGGVAISFDVMTVIAA